MDSRFMLLVVLLKMAYSACGAERAWPSGFASISGSWICSEALVFL
jgi:hypothetical protein